MRPIGLALSFSISFWSFDTGYKTSLTTCFVGQLIGQSAKRFFNKCQRCKFEKGEPEPECKFVGCEKQSEVICSEVESICSITLICGYTVVFTKNND